MKTLHLFAGAGGGIIADMLLCHTPIGAVEINAYCREVLKARQRDGWLPAFPIYEDIRNYEGTEISGVEMVCGGFPCQDISIAGSGKGIGGERSGLFFELLRIVRVIRPPFVFLENSPAIVSRGLSTVLGKMAEIGYNSEWLCLSAGNCGAWHKRERWWCLCWDPNADRLRELQQKRAVENFGGWLGNVCQKVSNADSKRLEKYWGPKSVSATLSFAGCSGREVSNACDNRNMWWNLEYKTDQIQRQFNTRGKTIDGVRKWWEAEPAVGRVVDGLAHRVDRLKALGNGQVPICAAIAQQELFRRIKLNNHTVCKF